MDHIDATRQPGHDRHLRRQLADNVAIAARQPRRKNTKARLDAELLHEWFAGVARHAAGIRPAAAAPGLRPDRDAGAAFRPAAPPRSAGRAAPPPLPGSAPSPLPHPALPPPSALP